jgi:hypothetical protein
MTLEKTRFEKMEKRKTGLTIKHEPPRSKLSLAVLKLLVPGHLYGFEFTFVG